MKMLKLGIQERSKELGISHHRSEKKNKNIIALVKRNNTITQKFGEQGTNGE